MTEHRALGSTPVDGAWRLNVLGPVQLCYDGVAVEVSGQTRALLALLARTPCEEVETASIVAALWGSAAPEDAESQVASAVSRLRKALTVVAPNVDPTSVVVTLSAGYILALQPSNADILIFERLLADGRRALSVSQPALALRQFDAALRMWRGGAYEDFGELGFARAEAARLDDLRLSTVEFRIDALLAVHAPGVPPQLVEELESLVGEHWHRERLWAQLMTVLARLGRRGEALAVYRRAQEELAQRLQTAPGAELRAVEVAVTNRDARLLGTPMSASVVPEALAATVPPCVGRQQEITWLLGALDLAATRRAQVRLIVGSAGIGKSRIIAELAQRAAERGARIDFWKGPTQGLQTLVVPTDRLSLVIVDDLDRASAEDLARVVTFVRAGASRPVVTIVTCRDPVRVGELASVPKLVLSALDDAAVVEIVRAYAPAVGEKTAVSAMANTGGVPGKVHKSASEWAFSRAGRRIDRAVAEAAEPRRAVEALREEIVAGALELAHVRARARALRPGVPMRAAPPYPGLPGFGPGDSEIFHGRETVVAQVLARMTEAPLLTIVGDSGTGKTALLRAGLLPAISAGVLPDSGRWRQVVVTPSTVDNLAALLAPPVSAPPPPTEVFTVEGEATDVSVLLAEAVPDFSPALPEPNLLLLGSGLAIEAGEPDAEPDVHDAEPAASALMRLTPSAGLPALRLPSQRLAVPESPTTELDQPVRPAVAEQDQPPTMLVVDQLEEVFVLFDEQRRVEFLDAVLSAAASGHVVVLLRADFYRHCLAYPELARLMAANAVTMPAMTEDELRRVIVKPAELAGVEVEPGLVTRLVAEVQDGNGGLPHLAVTLKSLWDRRSSDTLTLAQYLETAGERGLAGAIEAHAEALFARLKSPQERSAARAVLAALCVQTEDRLALGAPVDLDRLAEIPGGLSALEAFVAGGLVTHDTRMAQLAHDCVLVEWPRLRDALDEDAVEASLRRQLRRHAGAWVAAGRPAHGLYRGARLITALDWAERHGTDLSTVERDFIGTAQRAVLASETRRRARTMLLWKWLVATALVALLATAIAVVSVVMNFSRAAAVERGDAARLAVQATAEPDLQKALLLAVAATRLDATEAGAIRLVLQRSPDLVAAVGTQVSTVAVAHDGTVAAGTASGSIIVLGRDELTISSTLDYPGGGPQPLRGLAFTPDGRRLVAWGGGPGTSKDGACIVVWDVQNKHTMGTAFGQAWPDAGGGLLADHATLLLAQHGGDPQARPVAWNIDARTPSTAYTIPVSTVERVVVSPEGDRIAFGASGATVVLTLATGKTRTLAAAALPLAFAPDGRMLLAASGASIQVWDVVTGQSRSVASPGSQVLGGAFAADGASFATASDDGRAIVWSTATLAPLHSFAVPAPTNVWFSADGATLLALGGGTIFAFDLTGGKGVGPTLATTPDDGLVSIACRLAGRDITADEWHTYLPTRAYEHVCP